MRRRLIRLMKVRFQGIKAAHELTEIVSFGAPGHSRALVRRNGRALSRRELIENAGKLRRWLIFVANFAAQIAYIV